MKKVFCLLAVAIGVLSDKIAYSQEPLQSTLQTIMTDGHEIHLLTFSPTAFQIILAKPIDHQRQTVSSMVKTHGAYAGINSGYFAINPDQSARAAGALKIEGAWLNLPILKRGVIGWQKTDQHPYFERLTIKPTEKNKVLPIFDDSLSNQTRWQQFDYVVGGIPLLIKNQQALTDFRQEKMISSFVEERHARTAVCLKQNGLWLWLVASHTKAVDRPQVKKIIEGLTLQELTNILLQQGCVDAINLDGGGSSTLVIENKIINQPAGDFNPLSQSYQERAVYDVMLLLPKKASER